MTDGATGVVGVLPLRADMAAPPVRQAMLLATGAWFR